MNFSQKNNSIKKLGRTSKYTFLQIRHKDGQKNLIRSSTSLIIGETQTKTIMIRTVIMKKSTNKKCWSGNREKRTLLYCWWGCMLAQPLWRTVRRFLKKKKLKIELQYDPASPLLDIYPEKTITQKDTCTPTFIQHYLQ